MPKRRTNNKRDYQRSDRLNELLREVIAQELEKLDDSDLGLVSVSSVQVDNELRVRGSGFQFFDGNGEKLK